MTTPTPKFLEVSDVLAIHRIAIEDQGGDPALRDEGLLLSALAQPAQRFNGEFLHDGIPAMAAAYGFHICKNHPFVDGNKRAAFGALVGFLVLNDWKLTADDDEAEQAVLDVAAGKMSKEELTSWTRDRARPKPAMELRAFFRDATGEKIVDAMRATVAVPQGPEFQRSLDEAMRAIPLVRYFHQQCGECYMRGDQEGITRNAAHVSLLMHLYRLAEDMGYEW